MVEIYCPSDQGFLCSIQNLEYDKDLEPVMVSQMVS